MMQVATESHAAGSLPTGTCYKVLMWEDGALSAEEMDAWQNARREILARMRDAGIKGARGTLAQLGSELRELSTRAVVTPLSTYCPAGLSLARVSALAAELQRAEQVLACRLTPCTATVLVELNGEEGIDTLVSRWANATPGIT